MNIRIAVKDGVAEAHAECPHCGCAASASVGLPGRAARGRWGRLAQAITSFLTFDAKQGATAPAIATAIGLDGNSVRQTLARLRRDGSVVRRCGLWHLASTTTSPDNPRRS